jgi:hypothetical protein
LAVASGLIVIDTIPLLLGCAMAGAGRFSNSANGILAGTV